MDSYGQCGYCNSSQIKVALTSSAAQLEILSRRKAHPPNTRFCTNCLCRALKKVQKTKTQNASSSSSNGTTSFRSYENYRPIHQQRRTNESIGELIPGWGDIGAPITVHNNFDVAIKTNRNASNSYSILVFFCVTASNQSDRRSNKENEQSTLSSEGV